MRPFTSDRGTYYSGINRNKLHTLTWLCLPGRELLMRLLEEADVVIHNFKPGTLERWSIGYQVSIQTAAGAGEFPYMVEDSLVGFLDQSSRFCAG